MYRQGPNPNYANMLNAHGVPQQQPHMGGFRRGGHHSPLHQSGDLPTDIGNLFATAQKHENAINNLSRAVNQLINNSQQNQQQVQQPGGGYSYNPDQSTGYRGGASTPGNLLQPQVTSESNRYSPVTSSSSYRNDEPEVEEKEVAPTKNSVDINKVNESVKESEMSDGVFKFKKPQDIFPYNESKLGPSTDEIVDIEIVNGEAVDVEFNFNELIYVSTEPKFVKIPVTAHTNTSKVNADLFKKELLCQPEILPTVIKRLLAKLTDRSVLNYLSVFDRKLTKIVNDFIHINVSDTVTLDSFSTDYDTFSNMLREVMSDNARDLLVNLNIAIDEVVRGTYGEYIEDLLNVSEDEEGEKKVPSVGVINKATTLLTNLKSSDLGIQSSKIGYDKFLKVDELWEDGADIAVVMNRIISEDEDNPLMEAYLVTLERDTYQFKRAFDGTLYIKKFASFLS